jgi:hypothetical protein
MLRLRSVRAVQAVLITDADNTRQHVSIAVGERPGANVLSCPPDPGSEVRSPSSPFEMEVS